MYPIAHLFYRLHPDARCTSLGGFSLANRDPRRHGVLNERLLLVGVRTRGPQRAIVARWDEGSGLCVLGWNVIYLR